MKPPVTSLLLLMASAALLLPLPSAHALDAGVIGPTYEIAEPHLLKFIEQRLRQKEASGELRRLQDEARKRGVDTVRHPEPVSGVATTQTRRSFYYDPTYTLDRNVQDGQGRLMFAAGTRTNPLDIVSLPRRLLFFDARDPRQVVQARALIAQYDGRVKPILTGGSYLDLMKTWQLPVYYDQLGMLTKRLGIRQVPALVSQEGKRLRIDELEVAQ
ncbi:type-F conjugative transfer system protein TraW [Diaphorobacter nitroreducens]|uniref:type-F conjugative transfer system protein TraW n=1 Tax=Diaphorobacter nitroreducens TaxID=164759 RepID=UPI000B59D83C|nr:type-F conjugative transfer system protein TraW [Diaphorobacter nitroreducens]ASI68684.1 type-F conjugative transfer system protein TraW [Diaphorobacter nitroreducens]